MAAKKTYLLSISLPVGGSTISSLVTVTVMAFSLARCAAFTEERQNIVTSTVEDSMMHPDGNLDLFAVSASHKHSSKNISSFETEDIGNNIFVESTEASHEPKISLHESFGVKQIAEGAETMQTIRIIEESIQYMAQEVMVKPRYESIRNTCRNDYALCAFWAGIGECERYSPFMAYHCAPSCKVCHLHEVPESGRYRMTPEGEVEEKDTTVWREEQFGVRQRVYTAVLKQTERVLIDMITYMEEEVMVQRHYEEVRGTCVNKSPLCALWAINGECQKSHQFMTERCAPTCKACHMHIKDFKEERFGVKQRIEGYDLEAAKTRRFLSLSVAYMDETVFVKPRYHTVKHKCQNKKDLCTFWASTGQCKASRWFMTTYCAPACRLCLLFGSDKRAVEKNTSYREHRPKKRLTLPAKNNTNTELMDVMDSIANGALFAFDGVGGARHSF